MFITFNIKNKITKMIEKSKCLEGQIGVLKKEQKVKSETLCKECEARKIAYTNTTNAEIANLEAQIETKKKQIITYNAACDQQLKVDLDKAINDYDLKITKKLNEKNRLTNLIEAEHKNNMDVMVDNAPNAPTKRILNEDIKSDKNK